MKQANVINGLKELQPIQHHFETSKGLGAVQMNTAVLGIHPLKHIIDSKPFTLMPRLMNFLMSSSHLSKSALDLFRSLYSLCSSHPEGRRTLSCRFTRDYLGELINRSRRTVTRVVKELEDMGFLIVKRSFVSKVKKGINQYILNIPMDLMKVCVGEYDRSRKGCVHHDPGSAQSMHQAKESYQEIEGAMPMSNPHTSAENGTYINKVIINNNTGYSKEAPEGEEENNEVIKETKQALKNGIQRTVEDMQKTIQDEMVQLRSIRVSIQHLKQPETVKTEQVVNELSKEPRKIQEIRLLQGKRKDLEKIKENEKFITGLAKIITIRKKIKSLQGISGDSHTGELNRLTVKEKAYRSEAKQAFFFSDINFMNELVCSEENTLNNAVNCNTNYHESNLFSQICNIVGYSNAFKVLHEVIFAVKKGSLSGFRHENGTPNHTKGFNIALKLIRENKWSTPKKFEMVENYINNKTISFIYDGEDLFKDIGSGQETIYADERVISYRAEWLKKVTPEDEMRYMKETGATHGFLASMIHFARNILPGFKKSIS